MELLTFQQLKADLSRLQERMWRYIDGRYAFKHGYERYPFRGVLLEEITGHDEYIARVKVYIQYWGNTKEFIYVIGRRHTIWVRGCTDTDPFSLRGAPTHLSWDIRMPIIDWMEENNTNGTKRRVQERTTLLKEEIVAAAWAPARVERLIAAGGIDALDAV